MQATLFEPDPTYGDELDFYSTPPWAVEAILPFIPRGERWALLEPAAGTGALLDVLIPALPGIEAAWAIELHAARFKELDRKHPNVCVLRDDFFAQTTVHRLFQEHPARKLIPLNPPYSSPYEGIGLDFVEKSIELAGPEGFVAALLPLDFATGVERCARIHDKYRGSVYPLRRRPDFGGEFSGKRPFAWFTFDLAEPKSEWRVIG
jgi:hypothetical protein